MKRTLGSLKRVLVSKYERTFWVSFVSHLTVASLLIYSATTTLASFIAYLYFAIVLLWLLSAWLFTGLGEWLDSMREFEQENI